MSSLFQRIKEIENTEATPCNQSELIETLGYQRSDEFDKGYACGLHDARIAVHTIRRMLASYIMNGSRQEIVNANSILKSAEYQIEQLKLKIDREPLVIQ